MLIKVYPKALTDKKKKKYLIYIKYKLLYNKIYVQRFKRFKIYRLFNSLFYKFYSACMKMPVKEFYNLIKKTKLHSKKNILSYYLRRVDLTCCFFFGDHVFRNRGRVFYGAVRINFKKVDPSYIIRNKDLLTLRRGSFKFWRFIGHLKKLRRYKKYKIFFFCKKLGGMYFLKKQKNAIYLDRLYQPTIRRCYLWMYKIPRHIKFMTLDRIYRLTF